MRCMADGSKQVNGTVTTVLCQYEQKSSHQQAVQMTRLECISVILISLGNEGIHVKLVA